MQRSSSTAKTRPSIRDQFQGWRARNSTATKILWETCQRWLSSQCPSPPWGEKWYVFSNGEATNLCRQSHASKMPQPALKEAQSKALSLIDCDICTTWLRLLTTSLLTWMWSEILTSKNCWNVQSTSSRKISTGSTPIWKLQRNRRRRRLLNWSQ